MIDDGKPLFLQIAERVEDSILDGSLTEESQAPSTNELAAFYRINPATAQKGITTLVDAGILVKRRGVGMFVTAGARERILTERRAAFVRRFIEPLLSEASALGLSAEQLAELIRTSAAASPTITERSDS